MRYDAGIKCSNCEVNTLCHMCNEITGCATALQQPSPCGGKHPPLCAAQVAELRRAMLDNNQQTMQLKQELAAAKAAQKQARMRKEAAEAATRVRGAPHLPEACLGAG